MFTDVPEFTRVTLNRVGGWVVGGGSCLFEDKKRYLLAPSVLGRNNPSSLDSSSSSS